MSNVKASLTELIGNTPLLELHGYRRANGLGARILAKLEYLNPIGSVKDRTAWGIIRQGERDGRLGPGGLIYDLTSGNTGIGLAAIAAARGYRAKFYARDCISADKISLLRGLGAEVVSLPNSAFFGEGARDRILAFIQAQNPAGFFANQIGNPANPQIHFETTGPEIWRDAGTADILVAAVGTGGTVSGAGAYLRSVNPAIRIVVVEPETASLPSEADPYVDQIEGVHRVSDIPPETLPQTFDPAIPDEILALDTAAARAAARALQATEGIFVGLSAGAAIHAATLLARRPENRGKTIVAILPDSGERYLSEPIRNPAPSTHPEVLAWHTAHTPLRDAG